MSCTFKLFSKCQTTKFGCMVFMNQRLNISNTQNMLCPKEDTYNKTTFFGGKNLKNWTQEEMEMLTETEKCLPLMETIMDSPLFIDDWEEMSKKDKDKYAVLSDVFSHDKIQSVSIILKNTIHPIKEAILNRWKKKKIEELGEQGFLEYSKNILSEGHHLHKLIQDYLNKVITIKGDGSAHWESMKPVLREISPDDVHCVEADVNHPMLFYHGRLDCAIKYKNKLCIVDWKLATKKKDNLKDLYDAPYQVAAYVGAFNISKDSSEQVANAIIVQGYRDGSPATVHYLNEFALEFYWKGWLRRLARNHARKLNTQLTDDT
ncbi:mitochondrial genome maintenance exonuclease 1-like [Styela clava]